jgi:hypothetical protein
VVKPDESSSRSTGESTQSHLDDQLIKLKSHREFDAIPIHIFPPVFPVESIESAVLGTSRLSKVVIQGGLDIPRRDYPGVFADLEEQIRRKPLPLCQLCDSTLTLLDCLQSIRYCGDGTLILPIKLLPSPPIPMSTIDSLW